MLLLLTPLYVEINKRILFDERLAQLLERITVIGTQDAKFTLFFALAIISSWLLTNI